LDSLAVITALKALDGLSQRSIVTAENIANAGTANYRPSRVTFEAALSAAAARGGDAVRDLQPIIERSDQPELRLDLEMATASSTQLRYAALIEVLNRQLQLHALAIKGTL